MSRAVWSIVVIGFMCIITLVVAFLALFKTYEASPDSRGAKLALAIQSEYHFTSVGAAERYAGPKRYILVEYETHVNSNWNTDLQASEMKRVAEFALEKMDKVWQKEAEEIKISRTEIHGRGCFQKSYRADQAFPNPKFGILAPPPR